MLRHLASSVLICDVCVSSVSRTIVDSLLEDGSRHGLFFVNCRVMAFTVSQLERKEAGASSSMRSRVSPVYPMHGSSDELGHGRG